MMKLALTISNEPIKCPFHYCNYPIFPVPGMREKKYRETLLKLQIMENMRFAAFAHEARYTAADIRRYTCKRFINLFELWQVAEYQIFGTEIPPEYYSFLLDWDRFADPPPHFGLLHVAFRQSD